MYIKIYTVFRHFTCSEFTQTLCKTVYTCEYIDSGCCSISKGSESFKKYRERSVLGRSLLVIRLN